MMMGFFCKCSIIKMTACLHEVDATLMGDNGISVSGQSGSIV